MHNKEFIVFEKSTGKFLFTISSEPYGYVDNPDYVVILGDCLDPGYQYSLVEGEVIKGAPYPEITE